MNQDFLASIRSDRLDIENNAIKWVERSGPISSRVTYMTIIAEQLT